jgi:hypothetical protein
VSSSRTESNTRAGSRSPNTNNRYPSSSSTPATLTPSSNSSVRSFKIQRRRSHSLCCNDDTTGNVHISRNSHGQIPPNGSDTEMWYDVDEDGAIVMDARGKEVRKYL